MEKTGKSGAITNLLMLIGSSVLCFGIGRFAGTETGKLSAFLLAFGAAAALVSWFHMRLEEQEHYEKLEFDELTRTRGGTSLFNTQESETFAARRSRELFERFFIPAFAGVVAISQGYLAYSGWKNIGGLTARDFNQPLLALGLFSGLFLVLFLIGQYSTGVARLDGRRLLRSSGNSILLGAYLSAFIAAVLGAGMAGHPGWDLHASRVLCILLGALSIEGIAVVILEIYRPRLKGRQTHPLYESRLIGLISHPEGVFGTAASALDYQFGFKVSETWFYGFLRTNLAWLVAAQIGLFAISTCVVFINPGEQALLERFGRPVPNRDLLSPGMHFKLPYPVDKIWRHRTEEIQSFIVGGIPIDENSQGGKHGSFLWSDNHFIGESNFLSPRAALSTSADGVPPLSLTTISIPIHFQISNLRDYAYNFSDSSGVLRQVAEREVTKYFASTDSQDLLSHGQGVAAKAIERGIQTQIDQLKLGVKLLFVGLQDIHPPSRIVNEFERVISARQWVETNRLAARTFAVSTNLLAGAASSRILGEAQTRKANVINDAKGRGERFQQQQVAFEASPDVYSHRLFLRSYTNSLMDSRKIIVTLTNVQLVPQIDLQERISGSLLQRLAPTPKP